MWTKKRSEFVGGPCSLRISLSKKKKKKIITCDVYRASYLKMNTRLLVTVISRTANKFNVNLLHGDDDNDGAAN